MRQALSNPPRETAIHKTVAKVFCVQATKECPGKSNYIVECGCLNSAGFYAADITAIVQAVIAFFAEKIRSEGFAVR